MSPLPLSVSVAAQQAAPRGGLPFDPFLLMMGTIFAIFYFLVFRPQQKQRRALEDSIKSAAKGDQVITAGGLYGKIVATSDDAFTIEISSMKGQSVRAQVARSKIEQVISARAAADAAKDEGEKKKDEKKDEKKKSGRSGEKGEGS